MQWLESEFRDFNVVSGYPLHRDVTTGVSADASALNPPSFEFTRRYKWETAQRPIRWLLARLGRRNQTLIDRRSWKRAA